MAVNLIVEDGTKVTDANSYCSLSYANAYHTKLGNTDWTGITDSNIQAQALILATQSLELLYGQRFISFPASSYQSLLFPRFLMIINKIQVVQANTMPHQLLDATAEVALMSVNGVEIFPTQNINNFIESKDVSISGGPSKKVKYSKMPFTEQFVGFNKIDLILKPIIMPLNASGSLSL